MLMDIIVSVFFIAASNLICKEYSVTKNYY